ncbi:hypothetical protein CIRG_09940 [Coccidioides immitis RMSCC 2394]|uniref:Uncharacterized protein n=1 Tax=Coccidioides immitis RMSCC 2394 TaxID=404692 RepID=A0A0J6YSH9_COCIT|nr:hypothetical protein CIRG_09940 [Coccidioides immitis RMSCC 2394]
MKSDGPEQPAKCSWTGVSYPIPSQLLRDDGGDFSDDPLDDTGLDLYCKAKLQEWQADDKWCDPKHALCKASDNDIHWFLGWCLKLQQGKDCCHLKRTKKASSFKSDWQSFCQYYKKVTKSKMHDEDSTNMWWGIKFLIMEHSLDMQKGRKVLVYIEDMVPFNKTILSTQEKKFWLGFKWIQVCLYNTLGLFTIHQKNVLLSLQYKDLQFSLQKDPKGGPSIPLVELTVEGVKTFMGSTDFLLPTYIPLWDDVPCQGISTFWTDIHGTAAEVICEKMGCLLVVFSEIHDWLYPLFSHQFCYGGGKILNESDHHTFVEHYHPQTVSTDMIWTICGLDLEKELM